mmetsp:Transcript_104218/g.127330  ORF Transcript_104218/g.127330 Transcript_104218/m.127330 type:complete len:100 (-) Transcript_104218:258-557(-)
MMRSGLLFWLVCLIPLILCQSDWSFRNGRVNYHINDRWSVYGTGNFKRRYGEVGVNYQWSPNPRRRYHRHTKQERVQERTEQKGKPDERRLIKYASFRK